MPKVTVIVPVYNVEKYLDKCMESLLLQTLKDIEIIMVDDGSPDNCPKMCDEWAKKDERIKVVHKKNAGLGMACNSGLEVAKGDYIAFCDSDDWVDSDAYQSLYQAAVNNNADVVMTSFRYVSMEGSPLPKQSITYGEKEYSKKEDIEYLMKGMIASAPSGKREREFQASAKVVLYRSEIIRKNNVRFVSEREIPSEDLIFNLDILSRSNRVVTLNEIFYNYRFNPSSITHHVKRNAYEISKSLYRYLDNKVQEIGLGKDGRNRVKRMFIGTTRATVSRVLKSSLSSEEKREYLNSIYGDSTLKSIVDDYPTKQMPLRHRFFLWATVGGHTLLLKLMTVFMNH